MTLVGWIDRMSSMKLTSSHVKAALRLHYSAPQYAILEEVRNATGMLKKRKGKQPRYADMVAMGLWPSIGLDLTGFEVKVTRADWLNEISDEKKAVAVAQFCDYWYLVTPANVKIVNEGELPAGWGWLIVDEDLKVKMEISAPRHAAMPITREFLASLMRNATTSNPDYVAVQADIIKKKEIAVPIKTRAGAKAHRRRATTSKTAVARISRAQACVVISND